MSRLIVGVVATLRARRPSSSARWGASPRARSERSSPLLTRQGHPRACYSCSPSRRMSRHRNIGGLTGWAGRVGGCDPSADHCASRPACVPRVAGWQDGAPGRTLDGHRAVMEELLVALTSVGRRFGAGLGSGLDARSEALLRGEWGGIRVTWEEVSEDEYEE